MLTDHKEPIRVHSGIGNQRVQRDTFVDSWRGVFHVIILIDHLPFFLPFAFSMLAQMFEPLGYLSIAEGFVFLSGYVSGLVYTRLWRNQGKLAVWRKVQFRVAQVYGCYVLAVMVLLVLVRIAGESCAHWGSWQELIRLPTFVAFAKVASLSSQPAFLEILPMYCFFLLGIPLILTQLEKRRFLRVALISLTIWVLAQFGARETLFGLISARFDIQLGFFNIFAWQILFVAGMMCGHQSSSAQRWLPKGRRLVAFAYVTALVLFALRHGILPIRLDDKWIDSSHLGLLRLTNFACIAYLICSFRERIESLISWAGFALLSRHSLQVFAFHLIPIYFAALYFEYNPDFHWLAPLATAAFCILWLFVIALLSHRIALLTSGAVRKLKATKEAL